MSLASYGSTEYTSLSRGRMEKEDKADKLVGAIIGFILDVLVWRRKILN